MWPAACVEMEKWRTEQMEKWRIKVQDAEEIELLKKRNESEQNKVKREWERILKTTLETENQSSNKSRAKV